VQSLFATASFNNNNVELKGNINFINRLLTEGIIDKSFNKINYRVYPKDGLHFLVTLQKNIQSPYLSSSNIIEE
jgi:hypothetical protein